jgi:chorismate mutase/prephenate dehydratase
MEDKKLDLIAQIDALDKQIAKLLIDRFAVVKAIGQIKKENGSHVKDLNRENEVIHRVQSFAYNEDEKKAISSIYQKIIDECCELQK